MLCKFVYTSIGSSFLVKIEISIILFIFFFFIAPVKIVMSSAAEIKNQTSQSGLNIPVFSCTPHPVMAIDIVSPSTSGDSPIASPSSGRCTSFQP